MWPWFIVALAALVLVPIGAEADALNGAARAVADDRELAYPVVMGALLGPGILGLMVVSLLAAFMSTVDTRINWGASYIVNDVFVRLKPRATSGALAAGRKRLDLLGVVVMGVLTGVVGGVIRDVLTAEIPMILHRGELYATAAITGAAVFLVLVALSVPAPVPALVGMAVIVGLRFASVFWGLRIPLFSLDRK